MTKNNECLSCNKYMEASEFPYCSQECADENLGEVGLFDDIDLDTIDDWNEDYMDDFNEFQYI